MTIRVLTEETINKIAAGEVIENPASVVKELVENAIDAKSTQLTVEIKAGGFSLIRVSDNGLGMSRDDLLLCLERHATSKIRNAEDLNEVLSMGFRGEALASIAAISRMRFTSCRKDKALGCQISCNGGKLLHPEDAARSPGTTVEVRALFYNVPARKKFQKSAAASQVEIMRILTKLALANPQIQIHGVFDEKKLLNSSGEGLNKTCKEVLGEPFLKGSCPIDYEESRCHLVGCLGSPLEARKNRLGQYLVVNGRGVTCPEINRGIYEAYGTRLGSRDHPTFVLHLTLPTHWIDVNVHPQKREIRLGEKQVIQEVLRKGVLQALQGKPLEIKAFPQGKPLDWSSLPPLRFQEIPNEEPPLLSLEANKKDLPIIGQFDHFLLLDGRMSHEQVHIPHYSGPYDGILVFDLEAAHAQILFERFLNSGVGMLQVLMIPQTLEFAPHEYEKLNLHLEAIKKMGVEMRSFGKNCFIVEALSPEIQKEELKSLMHTLLNVFDQKISEKEQQKTLALTVSRHARSYKKGWTIVEAKYLVKQLLNSNSPYFCPKGKPIVVHLSYEDITQFFQKTR